jgi:uroporphyrin-III C-methyltransferase / precorrin-2 dehydrogenase / sirohydrochlorin ferrochelatase
MDVSLLQPNEVSTRSYSRNKAHARVGPLAVLPVFFKLEGRRVLVAGGGEAAAWKAQLVAATGADVLVVADVPCDLLLDIIAHAPDHESYQLIRRSWTAEDFQSVEIAICEAKDDGEAAEFHRAGKASGVPVNVIDNPPFCDFRFGSIVNRSPAVVSVSTDGAAPVLGQAIRRRIETLLPQSLARWAGLAQTMRGEICERLKPGPERRLFWERFVDRAFSGDVPDAASSQILEDCNRIESGMHGGRVTLVGAGPGDAELLTLKAVRALQSADIILFDDLVSADVLELARREAKRMLVGKRGGRESCRQEDINDMMVKLANAGKHVVRLKGGDPMVFGRAGEEIARLEEENIPVSIVPGITSALAMASALGVSLTHRDHAQSVRFITGHSRKGVLPSDIDWPAVADARTTTIFYMGGRTAAEISERLIAEGLPGELPAVMMSGIARPDERRWVGKLSELPLGAADLGLDNPVLIGIGAVFASACVSAIEEGAGTFSSPCSLKVSLGNS